MARTRPPSRPKRTRPTAPTRPRKRQRPAARTPPAAPERVVATAVTATLVRLPWRSDPEMPRLTAQILDLQHHACIDIVTRLVDIGRLLGIVKARLVHGEWLDWLAHSVPFDRSSADDYVKLARFAQDDAVEFGRLRHLGPRKLAALVKLPSERRRALPLRTPLPVPGNRRKSIETMTVLEFAAYVHDPVLPPPGRKPIDDLMRTCRANLTGFGEALLELFARPRELDLSEVRAIRNEVRDVLAEIDRQLAR